MPPACWFLLLVWVWWLLPMVVLAEEQQQREGCLAMRCGNLTISQPFWLADRQTGRSCGSFEFEVTCINNTTPVLRSSGIFGFTILDISYEENRARLVDRGKLKLMQASNTCQVPIWNTSEKLGIPLKIDPVNRKIVLYNCTTAVAASVAAARRDRGLQQTEMKCGNGSEVFARVGGRYYYDETTHYAVEGCVAADVPVLGSSAADKVKASNYKQLILDGFVLTWEWDPHPPPPLAVDGKFIRQIVF
jgi:hypothetical protein